MKKTTFKTKYSSLKRTPLERKTALEPSLHSMKRSSFDKHKPLTEKQILDNLVSRCIRLGSADNSGMVICITCGIRYHWTKIQCGHFQKRGNMTTRYNIKNLAPQCVNCNCYNDGENEKFAEFIDDFYGQGTADSLRLLAKKTERYFPYEAEMRKWTALYQTLVEGRSNLIEY